jgi:hypothetical protein
VPVMIKDGRAVLFIHVPKAGGTSIERLFLVSGWEMHFREGRMKRPELFPLLRCSPQHYHAAMLTEILDLSRFDVIFTVVRDPIQRFRSEFAMRHKRLDPSEATSERVGIWTDRVLATYAENPFLLDNHLRPQTEYLLPGTEVYRLEDGLETMVADLNARFGLGLKTKIPHQRKSDALGLPTSAVQLSPELRARVLEFYADDASLGYPA